VCVLLPQWTRWCGHLSTVRNANVRSLLNVKLHVQLLTCPIYELGMSQITPEDTTIQSAGWCNGIQERQHNSNLGRSKAIIITYFTVVFAFSTKTR
jgi:hypothetical protein